MDKIKRTAIALLMLCGVSLLAKVDGNSYGWWDSYVITTTNGTNIYTTADTSISLHLLNAKEYSDFGYFTFDRTGVVTQKSLTFDSSGNASLGNISKDTHVGFWLTTSTGTVYTVQSMNTWWFDAGDVKNFSAQGGDPIFRMGELYNEHRNDIMFKVSSSAPTGQPLPGILLTSLIAMACGGVAAVKRKRKE